MSSYKVYSGDCGNRKKQNEIAAKTEIDANFSWRSHVEAMLSKATQRLYMYFLKLLKRAGVPIAQIQHFYVAVIRPILQYAAPVWHHLLTNCQTDQIEAVQKRAVNIIYNSTYGMPYSNPFSLPVSQASEHADNNCHATFLSLLLNLVRVFTTYCHLHVTLNYSHD